MLPAVFLDGFAQQMKEPKRAPYINGFGENKAYQLEVDESQEKKYKCLVCGMRAKRSSNLTRDKHLRTHGAPLQGVQELPPSYDMLNDTPPLAPTTWAIAPIPVDSPLPTYALTIAADLGEKQSSRPSGLGALVTRGPANDGTLIDFLRESARRHGIETWEDKARKWLAELARQDVDDVGALRSMEKSLDKLGLTPIAVAAIASHLRQTSASALLAEKLRTGQDLSDGLDIPSSAAAFFEYACGFTEPKLSALAAVFAEAPSLADTIEVLKNADSAPVALRSVDLRDFEIARIIARACAVHAQLAARNAVARAKAFCANDEAELCPSSATLSQIREWGGMEKVSFRGWNKSDANVNGVEVAVRFGPLCLGAAVHAHHLVFTLPVADEVLRCGGDKIPVAAVVQRGSTPGAALSDSVYFHIVPEEKAVGFESEAFQLGQGGTSTWSSLLDSVVNGSPGSSSAVDFGSDSDWSGFLDLQDAPFVAELVLGFAIRKGDMSLLSRLLPVLTSEHVRHVDPWSQLAPLALAARHQRPEMFAALLRRGASLDATSGRGQNVLHVAAKYGADAVLACALDAASAGSPATLLAMMDAEDDDGLTPLDTAVRFGNAPAVAMLVERGAEVTDDAIAWSHDSGLRLLTYYLALTGCYRDKGWGHARVMAFLLDWQSSSVGIAPSSSSEASSPASSASSPRAAAISAVTPPRVVKREIAHDSAHTHVKAEAKAEHCVPMPCDVPAAEVILPATPHSPLRGANPYTASAEKKRGITWETPVPAGLTVPPLSVPSVADLTAVAAAFAKAASNVLTPPPAEATTTSTPAAAPLSGAITCPPVTTFPAATPPPAPVAGRFVTSLSKETVPPRRASGRTRFRSNPTPFAASYTPVASPFALEAQAVAERKVDAEKWEEAAEGESSADSPISVDSSAVESAKSVSRPSRKRKARDTPSSPPAKRPRRDHADEREARATDASDEDA